MRSIDIDYRYAQDQLEALFRQARAEDVEAGGRFDTGSAALNIWTHAWTSPALRDESSLMGTFYAAWAEESRLWKAEEGFSLDDLLEVLGELEVKALNSPFIPPFRAVCVCGLLAKEELEAFLLEMTVVREDLGDVLLSHGLHGDTVCQAVLFVGPLFIECEALKEGFVRLREHCGHRVGEDAAYQIGRALSEAWSRGAADGQELREHFIGGPEPMLAKRAAEVEGLVMPAVSRAEERDPVEGISKESPHAGFLGVP